MAIFENDNPSEGAPGTVVYAEFLNALGLSPNIRAGIARVTASRVIDPDTDHILLVDASGGAITLTIPEEAELPVNRRLVLKKIDATDNAVTLTGRMIDDEESISLTVPKEKVTMVSDGTDLWTV